MFQACRRTRSLRAVLLLLFGAFAPGLHRWHHATECCAHQDAGDHRSCTTGAGRAAGPHESACADECGLCAVLTHGRDLWHREPPAVAGNGEPPPGTVPSLVRSCVSIPPSRLPPARGPPCC